MSKKTFTEKEIKILSHNQYVKKVSAKGITYTDEFKRIFVAESEKGKIPRQIFEEYGFDTNIVGMDRFRSASKRWRNSYKKSGIHGLQDTRKVNSRVQELSIEEKYTRLEAENNLLKAENELLKKLDIMERGLGRK